MFHPPRISVDLTCDSMNGTIRRMSTFMVKLHIRRKKPIKFRAISSEISIYSWCLFYLQQKTPSTWPPLEGKMDENREWDDVTKFRLKFTNQCFFQVKIAWNPRHCCAPNASWVSILSTASPAACRVWYILWNLLAPSTPSPKRSSASWLPSGKLT